MKQHIKGDCSTYLHQLSVGESIHYFKQANAKHYCHTIDTKTGHPIDNGVGSVTVSHPSCMIADAWATALLVLGPDKGIELANSHNIPALFLFREKAGLHDSMTTGFAAVIGN